MEVRKHNRLSLIVMKWLAVLSVLTPLLNVGFLPTVLPSPTPTNVTDMSLASPAMRFLQYYTPDVYAGTTSLISSYIDTLTGHYTFIVKDYVAAYYTSAITSYTRATLKVFICTCFRRRFLPLRCLAGLPLGLSLSSRA